VSFDISAHRKPGRRSIVGVHPQRDAIEAACAAGVSIRRVAERFAVPRMSLWRWWRGLPNEYRAALSAAVADQDDARWREVSAGLAAIARRYPETLADIADLTRRICQPRAHRSVGERTRAA
jgi:transposase-like protein